MDIGIGLPNSVPGATGPQLLEWARQAERAGFSSLASIGAVSYPSYEELTLFAAAGAVTERIRFLTNVLLAPTRSTAELAKQAATVDQLTGGRLTLGLGIGWRSADFDLTGRSFTDRGRSFDEQLRGLQTAWSGQPLLEGTREVAPPTVQPSIPMMLGGTAARSIQRVVEFGVGWTAGGMPPDAVAATAAQVQAVWTAAGRAGRAKIVALAYFSLGDTEASSRQYLIDYYTPMGADTATFIAGSALRSPEAVSAAVKAFAAAGVDELILDPTVPDPQQISLLSDVVF